MSQHKRRCWKQGGEGEGRKCNKRCWDILNKLLTISPPPKKHSHVPSNCTLGRGTLSFPWVYARNLHLPLNHYIFRPFPTKLETWMKHGKIVWKQLYLFKTMLICRVYGGRHHLLQLAPPHHTKKDLQIFAGFYKGFVSFWKVWVYFEERNHAVKTWGEIVGNSFHSSKAC